MSTAGQPRSKEDEQELRRAVVETALSMSRSGLSPGRSGNVSCRFGEGMLITPSGVAYESLRPEDVVAVGADGSFDGSALRPSSEWQFHLSAYAARPDAYAVVHTHSMHATVLACAHLAIPAFHYMVAIAGGDDIPLVPYATFGTADLARHVADGLGSRDACLMANHGQVAIGRTLASALELAHEVEALAEQYYKVLLLGRVHLLEAQEMEGMVARFEAYGANAQAAERRRR